MALSVAGLPLSFKLIMIQNNNNKKTLLKGAVGNGVVKELSLSPWTVNSHAQSQKHNQRQIVGGHSLHWVPNGAS